MTTKVPDLVPWVAGSAWSSGACSTVQAGEKAEVRGGRSQEHVVDEQGVPRVRRDEPDAQAVLRVRAGEQVPHEQLLPGEVREHRRLEPCVVIGLERLVQAAPPDLVRGGGLTYDELVVRAASGVWRRHGAERPPLRDHALGATHRVLVELRRSRIPVDGALGREPRGLQGGGPSAFGGAGGMRGHARGRRPCSWASTAAITAMFTLSFTSDPRCRTCTGCAMPTRIGPIASAPPTRLSSL